MIDGKKAFENFERIFGHRNARLFRAPGRVNLIGEHTDYNGGFVLPMAINLETLVVAAQRDDSRMRVHSLARNETIEFDAAKEQPKQSGRWINYVEGVARILQKHGAKLGGADILLDSDVPDGAGLSSSAALEISVGTALDEIFGAGFDKIRLALIAQEAEHVYAETKCGIMDQMISANGEKGCALLIDCRSLEIVQIPLQISDAAFVICDSRVKHELASSEYNVRRAECEKGVELLQTKLPGIKQLRDVDIEALTKFQHILPDNVFRRCRHIVTENARTLAAAEHLKKGEVESFGDLMKQSHVSMRDDFEITCAEIDFLVETANKFPGTYGARMTGGGFGGCTINLVKHDSLADFRKNIIAEYRETFGIEARIYTVEAMNGAEEVFV